MRGDEYIRKCRCIYIRPPLTYVPATWCICIYFAIETDGMWFGSLMASLTPGILFGHGPYSMIAIVLNFDNSLFIDGTIPTIV